MIIMITVCCKTGPGHAHGEENRDSETDETNNGERENMSCTCESGRGRRGEESASSISPNTSYSLSAFWFSQTSMCIVSSSVGRRESARQWFVGVCAVWIVWL